MSERIRPAVAAVSADRIASRAEQLAAIGRTASGGVTRLGLSPEEQAARDVVWSWLEPLGFDRRQDDAGNLFAAIGAHPRLLVGSHLDTVIDGGRYDGALGVIVAVEAAEALTAAGLDLPLEIVSWMGEEGVRFGTGLFGSATALGLDPDGAWDRPDGGGVTARQAARAVLGRDPDLASARLDPAAFRAYLEVHIEQSQTLEAAGLPVGVVSRITGLFHGRVHIDGEANHAGATRMRDRRDALAAAAEAILAVERISTAGDDAVVATVGELVVLPGAANVVPGRASLSLDIRSADDDRRRGAVGEVRTGLAVICERRKVAWTLEEMDDVPAVILDERVRRTLAASCGELGVESPVMVSRAGHDAQNCQKAGIPTGMLFVRSTNGSHNPSEFADGEDAALAARALLLALERLSAA